ncbi:hypothetical protein GMD78_01305 [Ornithinibacillus sp. L9]|uniref:DUF4352 domain-containing protein n=1 Tax=Ornithinibacillus caprae TaxID=2678566 RepID=A0A6N8FH22_9BACI|nr:hypothetical protein [Ornithinibacillus caprae]MUK87039.1 hypothetical protein [Ornithinibacillus caprae]
MKRKVSIFNMFLIVSCLLIACSGGGPVPDELIENADSDPIEIKDQYELKIGESGFTVDRRNRNILEFTLNSVEIADEINGKEAASEKDPERVYVIANFTAKNHGEIGISTQGIEYPVLVNGSDLGKIKNDAVTHRSDLLGIGDRITQFESSFNEVGPLEPGDERTGDVLIAADHRSDSYIIYFGYDMEYRNKLTWHFDAGEAN